MRLAGRGVSVQSFLGQGVSPVNSKKVVYRDNAEDVATAMTARALRGVREIPRG